MSKLTRYNQKLLAIIGTSILIVGLISLLGATYSYISPLFRSSSLTTQDGVDIIQESDTISQLQLVNIDKLIPLDTSKSNFLVPISQYRIMDVMEINILDNNKYRSSKFELRNYTSGVLNNFVYIDYKKNIREIIFKNKLAIIYWSYFRNDVSELLLFKVMGDDTNNDGTLNSKDKNNLYVFDIKNLNLIPFELKEMDIIEFYPLNNTNIIGISTIEHNKKNSNNDKTEILGFDTETLKLVPIISQSMKDELQEILDEKTN